MHEVTGNMHMHTPYSDGVKWHAEIAEDAIKAGLDFVIVTDHNIWVDGVERYYENENGRILLLSGQEIHNVRRQPQASHCLVYGAERELAPFMHSPQQLIDAAKESGGYTFLAHPHEFDIPLFNETNLGWHDWEIDGFTGLEIWNYLSVFKNRIAEQVDKLWIQRRLMAILVTMWMALHPERHITGAEPRTLALWDELLSQGKRIVAVGNSDAHGKLHGFGPFRRIIYPYEFLFRAVNTHALLPEPLNGDVGHDKHMILQAVGNGRSWIGYDMAHQTKGFHFTVNNNGQMGERTKLNGGATLQVKSPMPATIRLIHLGEIVAEVENETYLTHYPTDPGAYRVECHIDYAGALRGWIYSNPIYLW